MKQVAVLPSERACARSAAMRTRYQLLLLLFMFCAVVNTAYGQKRANKWHTGNLSYLNFDTSPATYVNGASSATFYSTAVTTISSSTGVTQFILGGRNIYKADGSLMPNGQDVVQISLNNTNSAIAVPKPGNVSEYFIFSAERLQGNYSVVDMTVPQVKSDKLRIPIYSAADFEAIRVTAVKGNSNNYWVIFAGHTVSTGKLAFKVYELSVAGISAVPVTYEFAAPSAIDSYTQGHVKVSPDRTKIAYSLYSTTVKLNILDFNATTGVISNNKILNTTENTYGIDFTHDSKFLYAIQQGTSNSLNRYTVSAGNQADIIASKQVVKSNAFGDLQLGPDKNLYLFGSSFTGVFINPAAANVVDVTHQVITGLTSTYLCVNYPVDLIINSIELSNSSITEGNRVGAAIGTLSSSFEDGSTSGTFSLVAGDGDNDNALFTIVDGELKAAGVFDFETKSSYTIRVRATPASSTEVLEDVFTISIQPSVPIAGYLNGLHFDGVNDYVEIPSQPSNQFSSETEFTVSMWFKANSMATAGLFNRPAGGGDMQYWLTAGDGKFTYGIDKLGYGWTWIGTTDAYKVGEWVQVTAVRRNVSGQRKMEIYANGVLVGSGTVNYTSSASSSPIRIGTYMNADGGFANGQIDNVSLWKKALTVAEIKSLGATTLNGNEADLAGYWRFDETTGTIAYDATANANHGTLKNMDLATARVASTAGDITTNEDVTYIGKLAGSDEAGNALTYSIVTAPTKGTLTLTDAATGAFTYTPAADINGSDVFTYKVNNGSSDSETVTINVTIVSVNDAPIPSIATLPTVSGECNATVAVVPTANDDNDGVISATTTDPVTYTTQGTHTISWIYTDAAGNETIQQQTVIVKDTKKPGEPTFAAPASLVNKVSEAAHYNLAYSLDLPNAADWDIPSQIPYAVNNAAALQSKKIVRIAYALELDNKWVWVSMDAFSQDVSKLGIPTGADGFQQKVSNMNVFSNETVGLTTGKAIATGNIEFWSNCYGTTNSAGLAGANNSLYDFDDQKDNPNCHGSFQIHNYGAKQTIFGYNSWSNGAISELGIGTNPSGHPDWTFANTANSYTTKKLQVFIQTEDLVFAKDAVVYLDANGNASITEADVNAGVSDNCGIASVEASPTTFTAANLGANTVTFTATDVNGNIASTTATVTVIDNTNPVFTSTQQNVTVALDAIIGTASVADYAALATTTDNTGTVTITQSPIAGTALVKNVATTVTLTAADVAGNIATQTFTVTATDQTAPVPTLANLPTITGECAATVTAPTATDNTAGTVTATTTDPVGYLEQGNYTITWTYNDGDGNTATQTQQVVVKDETKPVFAAVSQINQNNDADKCGAVVAYTLPGVTDNCSSTIVGGQELFNYTGNVQAFTVPVTGKYVLETWGAQGGNDTQIPNSQFGGRGGYSKGEVTLAAGTTLYIYVGGQGTGNASTSYWGSTGGGGATDIRLVGGAWNDNAGLYSRIIVAGGGGGRHGGNYEGSSTGNVGNDGGGVNAPSFTAQGFTMTGASQTSGGSSTEYYGSVAEGSFGFANANNMSNSSSEGGWNGGGRGSDGWANGGAGGGWYGGVTSWPTSSGGSGYVLTVDSYKPAGYAPISDYYMSEVQLISGNTSMPDPNGSNVIGWSGDGVAKISWQGNSSSITITQTEGLASGTLFPVGTTTNTFVATDAAGNTSTTSFDVTVTDTQKPTVVTQNITVNLDATGAATITAAQINNGSTDNCSIPANGYSLDNSTFTCESVGSNTVTLTVTDVNGNTSSATAIVTVKDVTAPIAKAKNITVQLDATGAATITPAMVDNGSSDICGKVTLSLSKTTFDCSSLGTNTVTLTATDESGNVYTTTATVTVEDKVAPVAIAQNITVQLDATGNATIAAAQVNNGSSDNCGDITLAISKTAFDCSNIGENTVTLTVTDKSGNTHTATAIVTVEDKVAPVVITQNITVQLDAAGNATITADEVNNGSTDACGIKSMSLSKTAFDCSTIGANTVTLTVTDNNGNVATKTAIVTVEDKITPIALTKNITVKLDAAGKATIVAADVDNGSSDVCGSVKLTIDKAAFDCSNIGENEVMLTVTDAYDNVATEKATVTVVDDLVPVVLTQNITVKLDANGTATITTSQIDNGTSDNCGIANMTLDVTDFTCENVGLNTVILTVTDVNGNKATKEATVTIVDEIAPTAIAKNITAELDANGTVTITAAQVNDNSSDNCGIETLTLDKDTFGCSNTGANTVILTVTDKAGNKSAATATVTIIDNIAPTITAPADLVLDVDAGKTTASNVNLGTPVTADNCDAAAIVVKNDAPTEYPAGTTIVTWTATDASGNKTTATQTVTVRQDIASVATLATINVPIRTAYANVPLPATVEVTYTNGQKEAIGVTWAQGTYNGLVAGTYVLTGQLIPAPNTTNQSSKVATISVVVEPNKVPTALAFSATTFAPNAQADDVIGTLTTTDPDDTQFVYTLVAGEGAADNSLFMISGDKVYLKSNNGLSGKTTFTIRVRSTDPYQNTIEKAFTLTKGNYGVAVDKLKIVNAFSPNGDGINDNWTIPELRFYNNVEIEVFDRSGVRLFHTTDPEMAWDGRSSNGQILKGAFFYIVQVKDINLVKKGVVTILKK